MEYDNDFPVAVRQIKDGYVFTICLTDYESASKIYYALISTFENENFILVDENGVIISDIYTTMEYEK